MQHARSQELALQTGPVHGRGCLKPKLIGIGPRPMQPSPLLLPVANGGEAIPARHPPDLFDRLLIAQAQDE